MEQVTEPMERPGTMRTETKESAIVREEMIAFEFHEAAWQADDRETRPPDPSDLSDRALSAVRRFPERDLPAAAIDAVEAECRRRAMFADPIERTAALAVMGVASMGAIVAIWSLPLL
ncbi:MAG: hypothetical protein ACRELC_09660 [Gemmatimonadota bacterium]